MRLRIFLFSLLVALHATSLLLAQPPAFGSFRAALQKVIAAAPGGFTKFRGEKNDATYLSALTIPGTYANGIVVENNGKSVFYEAYIRENMGEGESIREQEAWRVFLKKVLPDYAVSPTTRISKDFDKSIFRSRNAAPTVLTLYRDKWAGAYRLSFTVRHFPAVKAIGPPKKSAPAAR